MNQHAPLEESKLDIGLMAHMKRNTMNDFPQQNNGPISQQQLQAIIKRMFNPDDMSKWGSSEFDGSFCDNNGGGVGRTVSLLTDNQVDKGRNFGDTFEVQTLVSVGAQSQLWKVRNKGTGVGYTLKIVKKSKYGKEWRKVNTQINKYKQIVSIIRLL